MKIVIQRVKRAKISVDSRLVSEIKRGLLVLVGIGRDDQAGQLDKMARKVVNLRIFEDAQGKMNLNVKQAGGEILSVPQFTLYADTSRGNRPGFELSADPGIAEESWMRFNALLKENGVEVKYGVFGAHMEVELINDGPVTIII
ncbi:MAG: D-tyrosyl-tRNA(Tyr) deacylase [Candidatus Omnitrophica bacterium]|nr:D-tyrosyl-tRNA(Tyr) deacylase [Candidatus Omnitrophota bacterium]